MRRLRKEAAKSSLASHLICSSPYQKNVKKTITRISSNTFQNKPFRNITKIEK